MMSSLPGDEEILATLSDIIIEALRVDPARITLSSKIFTDLGAESLDVLDIRFRIEHAFKFKISDGEIIESLGKELTTKEIEEKLTIESILHYIKFRLQEKADLS